VAASTRVRPRIVLAVTAAAAVLIVLAVVFIGRERLPGTPSRTPSPPSSVRPTAPAVGSPGASRGATPDFVLVGAGDIADCSSGGDEDTAKLLDGVDGTVFTLGDNAYERGTIDEYQRCYDPTWGRQLARTKPVPGNHEYETRNAAGYFAYFGATAGDPSEGWYAYDAGAWRVYVLNSNCADVGGCDEGSAQERWLRADLANNPRKCVLAMWHHPLYSSGEHGNDSITRPLWQVLYDAGADLILNGHDHIYERFAPQAPDGRIDAERGIVEMVVGTGGRSHYDFRTIRPNSLVRDNTTFGVLRLLLSSGGWSFEFLPAGGSFTDAGSGTCH
jgi:hypothetical protein